jgi:hypothetical protein
MEQSFLKNRYRSKANVYKQKVAQIEQDCLANDTANIMQALQESHAKRSKSGVFNKAGQVFNTAQKAQSPTNGSPASNQKSPLKGDDGKTQHGQLSMHMAQQIQDMTGRRFIFKRARFNEP